jgi:FAD synthetase
MSHSDKKIVMAFGTFDYFHAGHENYLKQAKALGDQLIVVVARDDTVRKVKTKTAMYSERKRLRDVGKSEHVDKAVLGNSDDKYKVIKKYKPNILALGYDQFVFTYGLKQLFIKEGLNTKIVRLQAFEPKTFKSSIIRQSTSSTICEDPSTKNTVA